MRGAWAAVWVFCGCHAHVQLQAPEPTAPLAERTSAYASLRPLSMHETQHFTVGAWGQTTHEGTTTDYMQLADGRRVYYVEDILPVVPPGSPPAQAAEDSVSSRHTATWMFAGGLVGIGVGTAVMLLPVVNSSPGEELDLTPLYVGAGIMLTGLVVGLLARIPLQSSNDDAASAYQTYEAALLQRLALCTDQGRVIECGSAARVGPLPAEAAPLPGTAPPIVSPSPTAPAAASCFPSCRDGFACANGTCVSGCNPPCGEGQLCTGSGTSFSCSAPQ